MARNFTMTEAVTIISEGKDAAAIAELGKRFPILTAKIAKVAAVGGEDFVDLMSFMPEHLTANKVNNIIKSTMLNADEDAEDEDEDEEVEKPAKPAKGSKKTGKATVDEDDTDEEEGSDYDSMTSKDLKAECRKRGIFKTLEDTTKPGMIAALKANDEGTDAEDEEEDTDEDEYAGKTAKELFAMCRKAGVSVKPGKSTKFYIDALKAADTEEDDDWGDEEEEETPKKPAKGSKKTTSAKGSKKTAADTEEDDDDDWDI